MLGSVFGVSADGALAPVFLGLKCHDGYMVQQAIYLVVSTNQREKEESLGSQYLL